MGQATASRVASSRRAKQRPKYANKCREVAESACARVDVTCAAWRAADDDQHGGHVDIDSLDLYIRRIYLGRIYPALLRCVPNLSIFTMALAHWLDHLRLYLPADFTMPSYSALLAAYVLGGLTFLPLLICAGLYVLLYTTPPIGDPDLAKRAKNALQAAATSEDGENDEKAQVESTSSDVPPPRAKPLQGWLIARRTFEESASDATYIGMMRSFLDARSKDRRPRDTYYAVLKGTVLYLYEDEAMSECFAALDAGAYAVEIWPNDGLLDGELFAKRNCIRLSAKATSTSNSPAGMATVSKDMKLQDDEPETETGAEESSERKREKAKKIESILAEERNIRRTTAFDLSQPWHVFIKNNSEMEDWYLALVAASSPAPPSPNTDPLAEIFSTADMAHLVSTLDAQPDAIPTRWLNALLGRLFLSVHRTARVEAYILNRLASKLAKVKRPGFLTALSVRSVSVGSSAPSVSTPMLKELTKWGDAALELKFQFSGELRITIAATAEVSLGARFRPYVVQMVLAVIVRRVEGNVLVKVKRPPSNRIWYAFTTMPKLEIEVVPVVSDREIKWGVVLKPIETQLKEIVSLDLPVFFICPSVVASIYPLLCMVTIPNTLFLCSLPCLPVHASSTCLYLFLFHLLTLMFPSPPPRVPAF